MKLVPAWVTKPQSQERGLLVGLALLLGLYGLAFIPEVKDWLQTASNANAASLGLCLWVVACAAYESANVKTGLLIMVNQPNSVGRGWSVGVPVLIGIIALGNRVLGSAYHGDAFDHLPWIIQWVVVLGPFLVAITVGVQAYAFPNPLPALAEIAGLLHRVFRPVILVGGMIWLVGILVGGIRASLTEEIAGVGLLLVLEVSTGVTLLKGLVIGALDNVPRGENVIHTLQQLNGRMETVADALEQIKEHAKARESRQDRQGSEALQLLEGILAHQRPLRR